MPKGGGAHAPPDFGRSEGAAEQRRRAALLPAPPDFWTLQHACPFRSNSQIDTFIKTAIYDVMVLV